MIGIKDMEMPSYCLWDCPLAREDGVKNRYIYFKEVREKNE